MSIDTNKGNKIDCSPLHVKSEAYFKGVGDDKLSKDNIHRIVKEYDMIYSYHYTVTIQSTITKPITTQQSGNRNRGGAKGGCACRELPLKDPEVILQKGLTNYIR